jgi:hypothetical protein
VEPAKTQKKEKGYDHSFCARAVFTPYGRKRQIPNDCGFPVGPKRTRGKPGPFRTRFLLRKEVGLMAEEFWVLTRIIDTVSDPYWDQSATVCGSPEQINNVFDLSKGVPFGWRLLKNKQARRFLKWSLKEEVRWQREEAAKQKFGGSN